MSIYQRRENPLPDSGFEPGELRHLVVGNTGRMLDPRRTPVSIREIRPEVGTFVLRVDDFEDEGALWEEELENVGFFQFTRGQPRAPVEQVARYREAAERFDKPLVIPCDPAAAAATRGLLEEERAEAEAWLDARSRFFDAGVPFPSPSTREGAPLLRRDLGDYMEHRGIRDMEDRFARQFVSNPHSGELVKGHCIVIAELGLAPFEGKIVRHPDLFDGAGSRERRRLHVTARLGFVGAVFAKLGLEHLVLYRGTSTRGSLEPPRRRTFVSASFSPEVARSHFESEGPDSTGILVRQVVPRERVFMTYLETGPMNEQFKEAEAVLLFEEGNVAF